MIWQSGDPEIQMLGSLQTTPDQVHPGWTSVTRGHSLTSVRGVRDRTETESKHNQNWIKKHKSKPHPNRTETEAPRTEQFGDRIATDTKSKPYRNRTKPHPKPNQNRNRNRTRGVRDWGCGCSLSTHRAGIIGFDYEDV